MSAKRFISTHLAEGIGHIVLDRPEAYNALNTAMVRTIHETLDAWELKGIDVVLIRSTSPKVFSAGGDIKRIRQHAVDGEEEFIDDFFSTEYRMNARIAAYPVPVISLIDGLCIGGGLGLAVHGRFRLVTEAAHLSMPEASIGFFPDVGSSYFLPRLPGSLGMYLGLTGHQMDYRDALYCGIATHFVSGDAADSLPELLQKMRVLPVETILAHIGAARQVSGGHLATYRSDIDWCFGAPDLKEIQDRLEALNSPWSASVLDRMARLSPQSLEISLALLHTGSQRSLEECLQMELQMTRLVTRSEDFIEGVRAALVDKDRNPSWTTDPTPLRLLEPVWL
jgi:enoyl-CoA hydratase